MTRLTTGRRCASTKCSLRSDRNLRRLAMIFYIVMLGFRVNWKLPLFRLRSPAAGRLTTLVQAWRRTSFREVRVRIARINAFLQEHITEMPVVQLFNREKKTAQVRTRSTRRPQANIDTILLRVFSSGSETGVALSNRTGSLVTRRRAGDSRRCDNRNASVLYPTRPGVLRTVFRNHEKYNIIPVRNWRLGTDSSASGRPSRSLSS